MGRTKRSQPTITQLPLFNSTGEPEPPCPGKKGKPPVSKESSGVPASNPSADAARKNKMLEEARQAFIREAQIAFEKKVELSKRSSKNRVASASPSTRPAKQKPKKEKTVQCPAWMLNPCNPLVEGLLPLLYSLLDAKTIEGLLPDWKKAAEFPQANFLDIQTIDEMFMPLIIRPLLDRDLEDLAFRAFNHRFSVYPPSEVSGGEFLRFLARIGDVSNLCRFLPRQRRMLETAIIEDGGEAGEKEWIWRMFDRLETLQRKLLPEAERIVAKQASEKRKEKERRSSARSSDEKFPPHSAKSVLPAGANASIASVGPNGLVEKTVAGPAKPPSILDLPPTSFEVPIVMETSGETVPFVAIHGPEGLTAIELSCEAVRIQQLKEFDQLLCQDAMLGVIPHRYQIECARRVLTRFRGRAILADEVGLGKTIEAGMVIKEYLLRGLAKRVLVLVPPALVGQWQSEMQDKFGLVFMTTSDPTFKEDPDGFWDRPLTIASLGLTRIEGHSERCVAREYDLVIVDEAHHLKAATSKNHKLVKQIRRKFLLLLTATPIQNDLVELYNLINLLRPGTLGTQAEFKGRFVKPGHPTEPLDRDRLRELLSTVMIRNTRGFVDVKLPRRFAATRLIVPTLEETAVLDALQASLRTAFREEGSGRRRMVFANLLGMAGSSPSALRMALARARTSETGLHSLPDWFGAEPDGKTDEYPLQITAKDRELLGLLRQAPGGKVLVFTRFTDTLSHMQKVLDAEGIRHSVFHGGLDGPARDRAVEAFRNDVPVMLATETGGEGRNLQFCNTLVNYDLPWNPMRIEQRIGRLHRIGQTRDVFIFNLCLRGTIEERILKVLEEKINLFELVVGEVDMILGHLKGEDSFEDLVLEAWLGSLDESERTARFEEIATKVARARRIHETVKSVDEALFKDEFQA
ncbi:MAG: SNF2-related protein [Candidatus Ozemobacteraceae bacterium]